MFFAGSVRYDEGESEAECLSSSMDMANPIFQLYEAVRGCRNNQGQLLCEPFLMLPSRREYPDYYQQIKQPTSLQMIRYAQAGRVVIFDRFSLANMSNRAGVPKVGAVSP